MAWRSRYLVRGWKWITAINYTSMHCFSSFGFGMINREATVAINVPHCVTPSISIVIVIVIRRTPNNVH